MRMEWRLHKLSINMIIKDDAFCSIFVYKQLETVKLRFNELSKTSNKFLL